MDTLKERFLSYIKKKEMSVNAYARLIGVSQSTLSSMLGRDTQPSSKLLLAMSEHSDLNPDWLLTGEGSMYRPSSASVSVGQITGDGNVVGRDHLTVSARGGGTEVGVNVMDIVGSACR